jgi:hypothetical protein
LHRCELIDEQRAILNTKINSFKVVGESIEHESVLPSTSQDLAQLHLQGLHGTIDDGSRIDRFKGLEVDVFVVNADL